MAVKDKKQRLPLTFLAFVHYHLLLASLSSNNPKQSCSRGGLVLEETGLQYVLFFWCSLQTPRLRRIGFPKECTDRYAIFKVKHFETC